MAFVYIIQDEISGNYYTESCLELSKRIKRHNQHTASQTTKIGSWKLVCFRKVKTIEEARVLEKKVKSYKSGNAFKKNNKRRVG